MARIFISHSSRDNAAAIALGDWLAAEGWDDFFLDLSAERGIAAGEYWERRLHQEANRCEAVVFLISRAWLESQWCVRELTLANKLNKQVFGVLIDDIPVADLPADLTATRQVVNLAGGRDHRIFTPELPDGSEGYVLYSRGGLTRLREGLMRAGLDARYFPWPPDDDPDRPPYRGLKALEGEDAGIFYGREAPTIEVLDRLRGLASAAAPRLLAIIGASGAGKSSFLRAGIAPRLKRDDRNFLMLPILRPERAALSGETGLVRILETAAKSYGLRKSRAEIRAAVSAGAETLSVLLAELVAAAGAPDGDEVEGGRAPRMVLAIDQGEELFLAEGQEEANGFLDLIRDLAAAPDSALIVIFTIRSDAFERLQTAPALDGLNPQTFSLPPMPRGAYQTVIEGPARRLAESDRKLAIEPALTAALLADIEAGGGKDALPLLAFTLERLYVEYGGGGALTLAQYRELGGIRGSIEAAVETALDEAAGDPSIPQDRAARLALLRRALVPWLAGIEPETGAPRRRVARLSEIPQEARPLVDHLIAVRLLSTDVSPETGERTVEPAHEALLRQWGLLQGWLEEDFAALATLEGIRRAARDWAANGEDAAWLAHTAGRLEDAEAVARRDDFAGLLEPTDRAYLAAARTADDARRNRELEEARKLAEARRRVARRTQIGLIAASVLAVAAIGAAGFAWVAAERAVRNETFGLAALSQAERLQGRPSNALKLALVAWPRAGDAARPQLKRTVDVLAAALAEQRQRAILSHDSRVLIPTFTASGDRVVTIAEKSVRTFNAETGEAIAVIKWDGAAPGDVAAVAPDGSRAVTARKLQPATLWDLATGRQVAALPPMTAVGFSSDGKRVAGVTGDTVRIWDAATGTEITHVGGQGVFESLAFSPDGKRLLTSGSNVRVWDAATGAALVTFGNGLNGPIDAAYSPDGTRVVTVDGAKSVRIWDAATGAALAALPATGAAVSRALFFPDGLHLLTTDTAGIARMWDAQSGELQRAFGDVSPNLVMVAISPDGSTLATSQSDTTVTLWDVETGEPVASLRDHVGRVYGMAFSPDGRRLVTGSADDTARIWDARLAQRPRVLAKEQVRALAWSSDGARIAAVAGDRTIGVYDVADEAVTPLSFAGVLTAAFSPDSRRVVTGAADGIVRVRDAASGAEVTTLKGHGAAALSAAFSPDGSRIVTASGDGTARVWDASSGAELAVLRGHGDAVFDAVFSADGKRILTQGRDGTVRLWDAQSGTQTALVATLDDSVTAVTFAPDFRTMVVVSLDRPPGLWDIEHDKRIADLGNSPAISAAFSSDGTRVATGGPGGVAAIWDAANGTRRTSLGGHRGLVNAVAFSPDGTRIVTGGDDGTVRVWDTGTGAELAVLNVRVERPSGIGFTAFSPDGAKVATVSLDGTARIWDVSTLEKGSAFSVACRRLGNDIDLADLRARYRLGEMAPICGDHAPQPVDWNKLD